MKSIKFKRTRRFLFNSENKYLPSEILINWVIWITLFTAILFIILFSIFADKVWVTNLSQVTNNDVPQPANAFSIVSFFGFISFLASLVMKWILRRRRKKALGEKNAK